MDPLTIGILVGLGLNAAGNIGNGVANYKNSVKADRALHAVDSINAIKAQIKENNANVEKDMKTIKADLDGAWNHINFLRYQNPQPQMMPQQFVQQPMQPPVQPQQVAQPPQQQSIQQQLQPTQFEQLLDAVNQTNKNVADLIVDLKQLGK